MGMAATRLARNEPLERKPGHKPDVANMHAPELVELFAKGYEGMRAGLRDGAHRYEDQDADGLAAEFLYPGFFSMFNFPNVDLLVALQKNYNDWLHDYATAANVSSSWASRVVAFRARRRRTSRITMPSMSPYGRSQRRRVFRSRCMSAAMPMCRANYAALSSAAMR
jgi:hypothetical protein